MTPSTTQKETQPPSHLLTSARSAELRRLEASLRKRLASKRAGAEYVTISRDLEDRLVSEGLIPLAAWLHAQAKSCVPWVLGQLVGAPRDFRPTYEASEVFGWMVSLGMQAKRAREWPSSGLSSSVPSRSLPSAEKEPVQPDLSTVSPGAQRMFELVRETPGMLRKNIAGELGCHPGTAARYARELKPFGLQNDRGCAGYHIAPEFLGLVVDVAK